VKAFHKAHYGPAHMTLTAVGDLDMPQIQAELAKGFTGWTGGVALPAALPATPGDAPKEQVVFMPEKTSVTVIFASLRACITARPTIRPCASALPFSAAASPAASWANVRDKEGLTYGISARLTHDTFADGDFRIAGTFAPNLLDKGIASTQRQLTLWYDQGVTDKEVSERKTNLIGSFKVGLATTDGMANQLLATVNRGLPLTWLDTYADEIAALTPAQVNAAIKKHLSPDRCRLDHHALVRAEVLLDGRVHLRRREGGDLVGVGVEPRQWQAAIDRGEELVGHAVGGGEADLEAADEVGLCARTLPCRSRPGHTRG